MSTNDPLNGRAALEFLDRLANWGEKKNLNEITGGVEQNQGNMNMSGKNLWALGCE